MKILNFTMLGLSIAGLGLFYGFRNDVFVLRVLGYAIVIMIVVDYYQWYKSRGRTKEMPVAVASDVTVRKALKTLPADPALPSPAGDEGYVVIRRLTYGEKMTRRSINSKMTVEAGKGSKQAKTVIDAFNEGTDLFDFATAIVSHNLTHKDGRPLNFQLAQDVRMLDGKVAEEISSYIDDLNNFEADEDAGN